jgi:hypothetical protein
MMDLVNVKRCFTALKITIAKLRDIRITHNTLMQRKESEKKKFIFESWIETAFAFSRAS